MVLLEDNHCWGCIRFCPLSFDSSSLSSNGLLSVLIFGSRFGVDIRPLRSLFGLSQKLFLVERLLLVFFCLKQGSRIHLGLSGTRHIIDLGGHLHVHVGKRLTHLVLIVDLLCLFLFLLELSLVIRRQVSQALSCRILLLLESLQELLHFLVRLLAFLYEDLLE